jgi:hypothetical protein
MDQQQAAKAKLEQARRNAQAARIRLQGSTLNSGAWYDARASLMFWESRAAVHAANLSNRAAA